LKLLFNTLHFTPYLLETFSIFVSATRGCCLNINDNRYDQQKETSALHRIYNTVNGRYTPCEENPDAGIESQRITDVKFDNASWLKEEEAVQGEILME